MKIRLVACEAKLHNEGKYYKGKCSEFKNRKCRRAQMNPSALRPWIKISLPNFLVLRVMLGAQWDHDKKHDSV